MVDILAGGAARVIEPGETLLMIPDEFERRIAVIDPDRRWGADALLTRRNASPQDAPEHAVTRDSPEKLPAPAGPNVAGPPAAGSDGRHSALGPATVVDADDRVLAAVLVERDDAAGALRFVSVVTGRSSLFAYYFGRAGRRVDLRMGEVRTTGSLRTRWTPEGRVWWVESACPALPAEERPDQTRGVPSPTQRNSL